MPRISIIVPVFGVEKHIERCARSLFCQTLPDLEYIFVNDCTKDNSMIILHSVIEAFPNHKECAHIINHEQNKGLPAARISGLAMATGEYILHCDSDDWLEPDCCKKAYEAAKKTDADILVFKNWIDDGTTRKEDNGYNDSLLTNKETALASAISLKSSPYLWNKLVRKDIHKNPIVFPNNNLAEDWVLSVQYAYYSKKTVCIDDRLYHYFRNTDSIMRSVTKEACIKRRDDEFANVSLICDWLEDKGLSGTYKWEIIRRKIEAKNKLLPIVNDAQTSLLWRSTFKEINPMILFSRDYSVRDKMRLILLVSGLYVPLILIRDYLHSHCKQIWQA